MPKSKDRRHISPFPSLFFISSLYVMAQQKSPLTVVGSQYCISEFPVDLVIVRKAVALTAGNLMITDILENVMFKLEVKWSLHDRRILLDPAGNPVVTLRQKIRTLHGRWQVFSGDSHDEKDLLFTAKTSSWAQFKIKMNVFLANNMKQEVPDFSLEGSYSERSCIVYSGDGQSKSILAQMHKNIGSTMKSILLGKDNFIVTVNPNVDYAFIVALISILDNINTNDEIMYASTATAATSSLLVLS